VCATLASMDRSPAPHAVRRLETAEFLSIGSELTTGETRDTNGGELARSLTEAGVVVGRLTALPDRREVVEEAFRTALARSDLVVSTGGLGPTPDDLTRESIAAVCGETPMVDPEIEAWLRRLWDRRGLPFLEINLKQAWRIPSALPLLNTNGTAPGWWVDRADGRVAVLLPGPPREMRPMWRDEALPRLRERGLGSERAVRTLRLAGIGESAVAERLGDPLLRRSNPEVATYARADGVDVRLSAVAEPAGADRPAVSAEELLDAVEPVILRAIGNHVWARGATTWSEAIGADLERLGWTLSVREIGTGGALGALLDGPAWLDRAEALRRPERDAGPIDLPAMAASVRRDGSSAVGLAVVARPRGADTGVSVAVATPRGTTQKRSIVFLGGDLGRSRAALNAASLLLDVLRRVHP
jgi:nicotinamide-nucleotide amidase